MLLGFDFPDVDDLDLPGLGAQRSAWWKRSYYHNATARPLTAPARDFSRGYGSLNYRKTALMLQTLQNLSGEAEMQRLMRTYTERYAFSHPTTDDFLALASEVSGGTWDGLLTQLIETRGTLDFAIEEVASKRRGDRVGYSPQSRPGDPVTWTSPTTADPRPTRPWWERAWEVPFTTPFPYDVLGVSAPVAVTQNAADEHDTSDAAPAADAWQTRYVVRQLGEIVTPVDIEARFEDGTTQRHTWDGAGGFLIVELDSASRLAQVIVDPERKYLIDLDRNNNGHRLRAANDEVRTLAAYSHFWTENALLAWALMF